MYIEKALARALARAREQFLCGSKKEKCVHRTIHIATS